MQRLGRHDFRRRTQGGGQTGDKLASLHASQTNIAIQMRQQKPRENVLLGLPHQRITNQASTGFIAPFAEPVLLQAAVGFVRQRALDQTCIQGRLQAVLAESGAVLQPQFFHAGQGGQRLLGQALEQGLDLVAHLIADLVGVSGFMQSLQQGGEQEVNKAVDYPALSEAASAA